MQSYRIIIALCAVASAWSAQAAPAPKTAPSGPVSIELSHALDEVRAERVEALVEEFNGQQKDVTIRLVRRTEGGATKSLNLVTREEYARFAAGATKFRPLFDVMREAKQPLDGAKLAPDLKDGLTDAKGQLVALPMAFSTPVLYVNKEAFRKAGLNPDAPPRTWMEMQETAGKLVDAGVRCAYTTSWPVSVFIDNVSAWDGAEVADGKGKLTFNGLAQVKHVAMMATWHKSKYFTYFGRQNEADRRFADGECAMLTSTSSLSVALGEAKSLEFGVAPLPYHDDVYGAPQNTLADGASLWVGPGLKPAEVKGVARFINHVLNVDTQIALTKAGGYLPVTLAARAAAESKLLHQDYLGLQVASAQLKGKVAPPALRVAQIERVRSIIEEELEAVWADRKPPKEALDNAVQRGNAILLAQVAKPAAPAKGKK